MFCEEGIKSALECRQIVNHVGWEPESLDFRFFRIGRWIRRRRHLIVDLIGSGFDNFAHHLQALGVDGHDRVIRVGIHGGIISGNRDEAISAVSEIRRHFPVKLVEVGSLSREVSARDVGVVHPEYSFVVLVV